MSEQLENKPLYNSRIIGNYIKLIKSKYSFINVVDLLEHAGMKPYEVADQGHWFTQKQVNQFHARLRHLTGNREIAREAGRFSASSDGIGILKQYVLGMLSPAKVFDIIEKTSVHLTRALTIGSKRLASNKIEVKVVPNPGVDLQPFQCENTIGFIESVPLMFNDRPPIVEHPECIFKGGTCCRYIITWQKSSIALWKLVRKGYLVFSILVLIASVGVLPTQLFSDLLQAATIVFLILSLVVEWIDKRELRSIVGNLKDSTDKLVDQININYNNTRILSDIGHATSRLSNIDDMLVNVMEALESRLDYDRGLILVANTEKTKLIYRAGFGYNEQHLKFLNKAAFSLERPESKNVFIVSFRDQKPFLINEINQIESDLTPKSLEFLRKLGVQSFICCPMVCDGESIGILVVDNIKSKRPLVQSDMSLLMGVAPAIGISIFNSNIVEAKFRQFNSVLQVMADTNDARDPLTVGHSSKVTEYALGICTELGLSKEYCETIRVAALLHDYGTGTIPHEMLSEKEKSPLSEYELVRQHASETWKILEQVNFEGIYEQVPEIAASHYEKIDGSGFPKGLKGDDIPLGGRILAVADFFETITSKRQNREPVPLEKAFQLLRDRSGTQFDSKIVESFINYYIKSILTKSG